MVQNCRVLSRIASLQSSNVSQLPGVVENCRVLSRIVSSQSSNNGSQLPAVFKNCRFTVEYWFRIAGCCQEFPVLSRVMVRNCRVLSRIVGCCQELPVHSRVIMVQNCRLFSRIAGSQSSNGSELPGVVKNCRFTVE